MRLADAPTDAALAWRLALVLDTVGGGDWDWHLETGLVRCGDRAATLLQLPRGGVYPVAEVFAALDDLDLDALHAGLRDVFAGRTARLHLDCPCRHGDETRWLRLTARIGARSTAGEPLLAVGLVLDVTEERRRDSQLRRVEKLDALGSLAAGVAHEINTPLQFVSHNLDFLASEVALVACADVGSTEVGGTRGSPGDPTRDATWWRDLQSAIAESIDGLERVSTLVRALKQMSHRGNGPRAAVDVNALIDSAVTLTRPAWKVAATMALDLGGGLPPIEVPAADCGQVLVNLIVNAAHAVHAAHPAGALGAISIRSSRTASHVEVRVTDTGTGIPLEIQNRVFEPFFTTKAVGQGTGQGLAIARATAERHGGTLTFETAVGRGTTFTMAFPIGAGADRAA